MSFAVERIIENAQAEARAEMNSRLAIILGATDAESAEDAAMRVVAERDQALLDARRSAEIGLELIRMAEEHAEDSRELTKACEEMLSRIDVAVQSTAEIFESGAVGNLVDDAEQLVEYGDRITRLVDKLRRRKLQ